MSTVPEEAALALHGGQVTLRIPLLSDELLRDLEECDRLWRQCEESWATLEREVAEHVERWLSAGATREDLLFVVGAPLMFPTIAGVKIVVSAMLPRGKLMGYLINCSSPRSFYKCEPMVGYMTPDLSPEGY